MSNAPNDLEKLRELVKANDVVMLTTVDAHGLLEARPMSVEDFDAHGRLWFFTEYQSPKADQLDADPRALVTLSGKNHVSIQGTAKVVRDPSRQRELWNKAAQAWLQSEPEDPKVGLVIVQATGAQYWETSGVAAGLRVQLRDRRNPERYRRRANAVGPDSRAGY